MSSHGELANSAPLYGAMRIAGAPDAIMAPTTRHVVFPSFFEFGDFQSPNGFLDSFCLSHLVLVSARLQIVPATLEPNAKLCFRFAEDLYPVRHCEILRPHWRTVNVG